MDTQNETERGTSTGSRLDASTGSESAALIALKNTGLEIALEYVKRRHNAGSWWNDQYAYDTVKALEKIYAAAPTPNGELSSGGAAL